MKKILFIRPPMFDFSEQAKKHNIVYATIPYGILSIITYINEYKKKDIGCEILDLNIYPWTTYNKEELKDNLITYLKNSEFDIIGLSIMYNHMYDYIHDISKIIKEINNDIMIIVGGACATSYYKEIIQEIDTVDAVCYSEGEIPILQLLESDDIFIELENNKSFYTKNKNYVETNYVNDLDLIPLINFDLIDLNKYSTIFEYTAFKENVENEKYLSLITTRGCPYNCNFCTSGMLSGKKVRKTSANKIISDIEILIKKYNINSISIDDDQFLFDKERAKEILKGIIKFKLKLYIAAGLTVSLIDDEIISLLKEAGLQMLTLPIESGSQFILHDVIHKPIKLNIVYPIIDKLKENNIRSHGNIIIGFPEETEEHRQESIDFIKNSNIDWCFIFCAVPLKGSKLYDSCIENNYIENNGITNNGYFASSIKTENFSSEEITKKSYLMNLELNFVYNNNIKNGNYETAIFYFQKIINKYKEHAFAYYYLANCYLKLNDNNKYLENYNIAKNLFEQNKEWNEYARYFNLTW